MLKSRFAPSSTRETHALGVHAPTGSPLPRPTSRQATEEPATCLPRAGVKSRTKRRRAAAPAALPKPTSPELTRASQGGRAGRATALLEVLLVVVLRLVERLRWLDLRDDRSSPARLLVRLRTEGCLPLLVVVDEDDGAVVVADVPTLAVQLRRIVLAPEHVEQLLVRHPPGVVGHLDDLGVSGRVRADVLVGRVLERSARVADASRRDSFHLTERRLDAPEAAGAQGCLLLHYSSSILSAAYLMK